MPSLFDRLKTSMFAQVVSWVDANGDPQLAMPSTPLPVGNTGFQSSSLNSTTTPIAPSATYTGTGESNSMSEVGVSCYSDVAGTLYFQFRNPGSLLWHTFPTTGYQVLAGVHEIHSAVKFARDFRVKFVNSAATQTVLEIFTYFGGNFGVVTYPLRQVNEATVLFITAGGTHQPVFAANGARNSIGFSNTSDTIMFARFSANAADKVGIACAPNGGGFIMDGDSCPLDSLDVMCATTNKTFYAWWT